MMTKILTTLLLSLASLGALAEGPAIRTAGVDHVGLNVPDLAQAEAFFSNTFGCVALTHIGPFKLSGSLSPDRSQPVAARADSVSIAMLRCGHGSNLELFEYRNSTGSTQVPNAEDLGASHIAFYTDDVKAGVAALKAQGLRVLGEPITMPSGDTAGETWVHFLSPWGTELELVGYPAGKGYEKTSRARLWHPQQPGR